MSESNLYKSRGLTKTELHFFVIRSYKNLNQNRFNNLKVSATVQQEQIGRRNRKDIK